MFILLIALLNLCTVAYADDLKQLEEVKGLLSKMKSRTLELEKMTNALIQFEQDRNRGFGRANAPRLVSGVDSTFSTENCGTSSNVLQVQQCVYHSVIELRKLSDELP